MYIPEEVSISYYEFIMTQNCNLRCKYCFDDFFGKRENTCLESSLTKETADNIIDFIKATYNKNETIIFSFFGGEPTLNWDMVVYLTKQIKNIPCDKKFSINTNVTLLTTERINFLVENNFGITMSIDGLKQDHDLNRSSSFDSVMKILPEIVAKTHQVSALMVVDKNNCNNIYHNFSFLKNVLGIQTGILFNYNSDWNNDEINSITQSLKKIQSEGNIPFTFKSKEQSATSCFDPTKNVSINTNGSIHFCHQLIPKMNDKEIEKGYGSVINGYINLDYFSLMKHRCNFNEYKKNKMCDSCDIGSWCKTGCIAASYHYNNKSYNVINQNICKIQHMIYDVFYKEII